MRVQQIGKAIKIPEDIFDQPAPFWIYNRYRLEPGETSKIFNQKIDDGYFYMVSNLLIKNPQTDALGVPMYTNVRIDMRSVDRNRVFNNEPIQIDLISTPSCVGTVFAAPSPVDNDGFSVNFTADKFKNCVNLNQVYMFSTSIFYTLSIPAPFDHPTYIDLLVRGYNVPENNVINNH